MGHSRSASCSLGLSLAPNAEFAGHRETELTQGPERLNSLSRKEPDPISPGDNYSSASTIMSEVAGLQLISQGTAYGVLIGLGVLFCVVILGAVRVQKAYLSEDSGTSEMFMVANRSVGTGLTASAVFSSWMWINETVSCAAMCYRYGLAVPLVSEIFHTYPRYIFKLWARTMIDMNEYCD